MDMEERALKRREVGLGQDALHISALHSEMVALAAVLQIEKSAEYRAVVVQAMKDNLKKQQEIAASRGDFDYELGKVL